MNAPGVNKTTSLTRIKALSNDEYSGSSPIAINNNVITLDIDGLSSQTPQNSDNIVISSGSTLSAIKPTLSAIKPLINSGSVSGTSPIVVDSNNNIKLLGLSGLGTSWQIIKVNSGANSLIYEDEPNDTHTWTGDITVNNSSNVISFNNNSNFIDYNAILSGSQFGTANSIGNYTVTVGNYTDSINIKAFSRVRMYVQSNQIMDIELNKIEILKDVYFSNKKLYDVSLISISKLLYTSASGPEWETWINGSDLECFTELLLDSQFIQRPLFHPI